MEDFDYYCFGKYQLDSYGQPVTCLSWCSGTIFDFIEFTRLFPLTNFRECYMITELKN